MRKIKLSGREMSVVRSIDFTNGEHGSEILERTHIELDDLVDVVNGLMDSGFIETNPIVEQHVNAATLPATLFEINPAYIQELRAAIARR